MDEIFRGFSARCVRASSKFFTPNSPTRNPQFPPPIPPSTSNHSFSHLSSTNPFTPHYQPRSPMNPFRSQTPIHPPSSSSSASSSSRRPILSPNLNQELSEAIALLTQGPKLQPLRQPSESVTTFGTPTSSMAPIPIFSDPSSCSWNWSSKLDCKPVYR